MTNERVLLSLVTYRAREWREAAEFALEDLLVSEDTPPAYEGDAFRQMDALAELRGEIRAFRRIEELIATEREVA
jgi:hypothetical protein